MATRRTLRYVLPPLAVLLIAAVGGGGYWYVKVRQRASASAVEDAVAPAYPGANVTCVELTSNGATWACAVVYRSESECTAARVFVTGSISRKPTNDRCVRVPRLAALVPKATAGRVAADVARIAHTSRRSVACARVPGASRRWACRTGSPNHGTCRVVRVALWTPWNLRPGGALCAHIPALRRAA